jgi:4-hydroxy-tetrahydrodipicolinate synthase
LRELYDAATGGDADRAAQLDAELKPLYAVMSVAPPAVSAKTALELLGVIEANLRLPMAPASEAEREQIRNTLADQGLLAAA